MTNLRPTLDPEVEPAAQLVGDLLSHAIAQQSVLLAQIEAGGVGINMQATSVVIIAEPQWKPSTEDQAVARAHRMSQVRTVQGHRPPELDDVGCRSSGGSCWPRSTG